MFSTETRRSASSHPAPVRRRGYLRRFAQDQDGVAAVEFALISIPFLGMLFAILECALVFWTNQVLETAVADAARQIYTGQFQQANTATLPANMQEQFRLKVCENVVAMFDCNNLKVDIRPCSSFPNGIPNSIVTIDGTRRIDPSFGYQAPGPDQIVLVRAAVEYPVYVDLIGANKSNLNANKRVLVASAAFRTEPYIAAAASPAGAC